MIRSSRRPISDGKRPPRRERSALLPCLFMLGVIGGADCGAAGTSGFAAPPGKRITPRRCGANSACGGLGCNTQQYGATDYNRLEVRQLPPPFLFRRWSVHTAFKSADEVESESAPRPLSPFLLAGKLRSYASNIRRLRTVECHQDGRHKAKRSSLSHAASVPARSLARALRGEAEALRRLSEEEERRSNFLFSFPSSASRPPTDLREAVCRATVQAVRAAADAGDYALVGRVVDAAVEYATAFAELNDELRDVGGGGGDRRAVALLEPRLFGEAIDAMTRSRASQSRLKKMWALYMGVADSEPPVLASPPTAFELNAMLKGLAERGRIRAALDLFRSSDIKGDAYTASTLFGMLARSIPDPTSSSASEKIIGGLPPDDSFSSCWQWREVLSLLDEFGAERLNNRAFAAALKVNERAANLFTKGERKHYGARAAMGVLERMKEHDICPDVITCSSVMAAFDKGRQWKAAVSLLCAMEKSAVSKSDRIAASAKNGTWTLPPPNAYTYATAISACARCNEGKEALAILDRMREHDGGEDDVGRVQPNSWVYNSALAACVESRTVRLSGIKHGQIATVLTLLDRMEEDARMGMDTAPNTVSYNTVLAAVDGLFDSMLTDEDGNVVCDFVDDQNSPMSTAYEVDVVQDLLVRMKENDVPRDSITYRNAIIACRLCPDATLRMLRTALDDSEYMTPQDGSKLSRKGRASEGSIFLINTALSVFASEGDMKSISETFSIMSARGIKANGATAKHVIKALGYFGDCDATMVMLDALGGDCNANQVLVERYNIDIIGSGISVPLVEEPLYSAAITSCINRHDLQLALQVFTAMKQHGLSPSKASLEEIIFEYCRLSMSLAGYEFKVARKERLFNEVESPLLRPRHDASSRRAKAAVEMINLITGPSPRLLSAVAKACSAAGLWSEGRTTLRFMQRAAVREVQSSSEEMPFMQELPGLHRQLMKFCARSGNVTAAIRFADDIQDMSNKLASLPQRAYVENKAEVLSVSSYLSKILDQEDPSLTGETFAGSDAAAHAIAHRYSTSVSKHNVGMKGEDWKLLMIAASKSGHWKLCIGTLPFLRPFVKATHPRQFFWSGKSVSSLDRQYERLARALTAAVLCFEMRSQYAWSVRAIYDWIEWSGRRPRKEAVFSTCRILAARGRAQEVNNLIARVLQVPASKPVGEEESKYSYERAIYTEAITALYRNGYYDRADELYAEAVAAGHLPWTVVEAATDEPTSSQLRLDLHGMTSAIAHSAVRVALQQQIQKASWDEKPASDSECPEKQPWERDVFIVTGKGKRSEQHMRPVIRPEVQRMLLEEFYPPLNTVSVPGNIGALRIPADDVKAWMVHQQEQKGVRLLAVAGVLKNLSSGSRLRSLLQRRPKGVAKAIAEAVTSNKNEEDGGQK